MSNISALTLLGLMGREMDYSGSMTLDEATQGVITARSRVAITSQERRRIDVIAETVAKGRRFGATHLSWA